ncbi:MAG: hypothetical protein K5907_01220 [Treponema sp.]|nr:hypothetical protein [Treponema sp.]
MRILFTAAGDTDPVRGYHDGAIMHILRHYQVVNKIYLFLTKDMQDKEDNEQWYFRGIKKVAPNCDIRFITSNIVKAHDYEALTVIQDKFNEAFNEDENKDAEWLINLSSGTPQIKTVMSLLALDYPQTKAIQVESPRGSSNRDNRPCQTLDEVMTQLEENEDDKPDAKKRASEPPLLLLKKHGLKLQIISLIKKYEYRGAYDVVKNNKTLFSDTTKQLLRYAVLRKDLNWEEANKILNEIITDEKDKEQLECKDDFSEYFQVMELCQRNKQLSDFIVKLSPVLLELGIDYLSCCLKESADFQLEDICADKKKSSDKFLVSTKKMQQNYPNLFLYVKRKLSKLCDGDDLYFSLILHICNYYKDNELKDDEKHQKVYEQFYNLRQIESKVRNDVAHNLTNVTENRLQNQVRKNSKQILNLLHDVIQLVRGKDIECSYDSLNKLIAKSLR